MRSQSNNGFDLTNASIPMEEILSGGPPRDGIPAIDQLKFVSAENAIFLQANDRVPGVFRNELAKAYPIRILNWHEIVNDRFADELLSITYFP